MSLVTEWKTIAADIRTMGLGIVETAKVSVTAKGFADEKVLGLMLLARTLSNVKSVLLLIEGKQIVEARTITRSCLENFYWTVAPAEEGAAFVRKMRDDEMSHRRAQGQSIFSHGFEIEDAVKERLRNFMRETSKQFGELSADQPISDLGLDSVTVIEMVGVLEDRLQLRFNDEDLARINTFGDLGAMVRKYRHPEKLSA